MWILQKKVLIIVKDKCCKLQIVDRLWRDLYLAIKSSGIKKSQGCVLGFAIFFVYFIGSCFYGGWGSTVLGDRPTKKSMM